MAIKIGSLKFNISSLILLTSAILVCFLLIDRGGIKSDLKQTLKDLKTEKESSKAVQKKADEAIAAKEALKRESDNRISGHVNNLGAANAEIKKKNSNLAGLEAVRPGLKDKNETIRNQDQQISQWRGKCAFLEKKIIYLGEPIDQGGGKFIYPPNSVTFELSAKYESQLSITGSWIEKYNAVCGERDKANLALDRALKDLKWEKFKSKAKTGIMAAAAGGALYFTGSKPVAYITWLAGLLNLVFGK
jgi:hypothetical protein